MYNILCEGVDQDMKKILAAALTLMMILSGCQFIEKEEEDLPSYTYTEEAEYDTIRWDPVTLKVEKSYLTTKERNYAAQQVESAVQAAKSFLSEVELNDVELVLRNGSGATMVYEGYAEIFYAQNRDIPYTSIITQIMAGVEGVPEWLREGVGAYAADINKESMLKTWGHMIESLNRYVEMQTEMQEDSSDLIEEHYYTIDELAQVLYKNNDYMQAQELGDMADQIASIGYAQEAYNYRGAYCIYAGSFVKYLEKNYSRGQILQVYQGADFEEVMGISFEEARQNWLTSLQ